MADTPEQAQSSREVLDQANASSQEKPAPCGAASSHNLGRYQITGHLGTGGMGEILKVRDDEVGREMAAKVIKGQPDSAALARFVREARITGQLEHPNIVPMHELGMTREGRAYFTMKVIEGHDLAALLEEVRAEDDAAQSDHAGSRNAGADLAAMQNRSLIRFLNIFLKVCDAVSFAHSRNVIHRDLKPPNIMVGRFGEVQVMDWGLARIVGQEDPAADRLRLEIEPGRFEEMVGNASPMRTVDGALCGTPQYIPPEQVRGEVETLDRRADIYSLGAMLYEMLTLEAPFEAEDSWEVLYQVVEGELIPPSQRRPDRQTPWELEAVVLRAMSLEPKDRYDSVADLKAEISAYLEGRALQVVDYSSWQVIAKWARRNKAVAGAALGIALSLLVGFAATLWQMNKAQIARTGEREQRIRAQDNERQARANEKLARDNEKRAISAKAAVEVEKRRTDAARFRMGDVRAEAQLSAQFETLGPQGWKEQRLRVWVQQASEVYGRLKEHKQRAAELENLGRAGRRTVDSWELSVLRKLIPCIAKLKPKLLAARGWLRDKPWLRWRRLNGEEHRTSWKKAIAAIAKHPKYHGLRLKPQEGLVPLGPDPRSTLWEFAHLPTGRLPQRDSTGRWQIRNEDCVILVLLPGGRYRMGATKATDPEAQDVEGPVHTVTLHPFFIGKYELTQAQWIRMTGTNPSRWTKSKRKIWTNPVDRVTWFECRSQLARVGLALPTEAQWEYATRGGSKTVWWTGNSVSSVQGAANVADLSLKRASEQRMAGHNWHDGHVVHGRIGSFAPNGFGLHDTMGNVWEWCRDPYWASAYRLALIGKDGWRAYPEAAFTYGVPRIVRGGSYITPAHLSRSARRDHGEPAVRSPSTGCRPARFIE